MRNLTFVVLTLLCLFLALELASGEIHRAKTTKVKQANRARGQDAGNRGRTKQPVYFFGHSQETWILAILSAVVVGFSGIFPLLVIPIKAGKALKSGKARARLNLLLSFAVGGLLGDVFLHLLPEAWAHVNGHDHKGHTNIGLWILAGLLGFMIIEKIFPEGAHEEEEEEEEEQESETPIEESMVEQIATQNGNLKHRKSGDNNKEHSSNGKIPTLNGHIHKNGKVTQNGHSNGFANSKIPVSQQNGHAVKNGHAVQNGHAMQNGHASHVIEKPKPEENTHIKTSGWLNLLANFIDNFTHGLAIAGSYCIDSKTGLITTAAILLHEIPHEIGDFAILIRAGFDRWRAAKAQLITAFGGLLGAVVALVAESAKKAGDTTAWILPFTSGGFLYIALVTIIPDLLKEKCPWNSAKQLVLLCSGIAIMASVTWLC